MDDNTFQKIKDVLEKENKISVVVGKNPSFDDMAAALGLYLSLKSSGKTTAVACLTDPIVELSSLVGIDKVKKNLDVDGGGDLTVSFPYKEGEIEKVSYTLENGYLNIVVKAGDLGLSFSEKDIRYRRSGSAFGGLLFIIGTPRLSDLGNLFNPELLKDTTVINIDNKSDNQAFGDIVLVSPRFSSVAEAVANLIGACGLKLDLDTAQNLLSGISFATNNFQDPKTTALAFEMAAMLLRYGAVRPKISKEVSSLFQPDALEKVSKPFEKTEKKEEGQETPSDWLTPKVYKGSTIL